MLDTIPASQLADICGGTWTRQPPHPFKAVEIDSRSLGENGLFIALEGSQVNGHDFVPSLNAGRNQAAIVGTPTEVCDVPQLTVADPLSALSDLAQHIASVTTAEKIALTGSVGKTGTKDMLAHCLASLKNTHATKGNLNNDIGAPLTIARMPSNTDILICELGMNHAGEINKLSQIMTPHIGVITRIADSHRGHFDCVEDIARAKAEIFDGMSTDGIAILPAEDTYFDILETAAKQVGISKIIRFGTSKDCELRLLSQQANDVGQHIDAQIFGKPHSFTLGMTAPHWANSALICLGIASLLGLPVAKIAQRLADMHDIAGRGAIFEAVLNDHRVSIIDDAYNAGPASMQAALRLIGGKAGRKGAILSDMLELGDAAPAAHHSLSHQIRRADIKHLLLIGPYMSSLADSLQNDMAITVHNNADDAKDAATEMAEACDHLLIKGSHGSGAWKLSQYLQQFSASNSAGAAIASIKGAAYAT